MAFDLRNIFAEFRQNRRLDERREDVLELLGSAEDGVGLLADPTDLARQVEFAGGLEALGPGQGTEFLSSILGEVGATERQEIAEEGAMRRARLDAQIERLNAADNLLEEQRQFDITQQGAQQTGFNIPGVQLGTVAPGMARFVHPQFGTPIDVGLPGSAPDVAGAKLLSSQAQAIENLTSFLEIFDRVGTEFASPDAQTMGTYRQRVISAVAQLDDMGVLQQGELERIESTLADPTSFGRQVQSVVGGIPGLRAVTGSNKSIRAGYQALLDQLNFQNDLALETFQFWPGLQRFQQAAIPEGFVPDEGGQ